MHSTLLNFFIYIISSLFLNEIDLKNQPNIIYYISDDKDQIDHNIYGNSLVPSDPINRLASEGMKFNNAYTSQAICSPSRSQIFTGLYPIKNGCYANHLPVKKDIIDVNDYLQSVGYEVVLAGKSHVNPSSVFNWTHYFKNEGKLLPMDKIKHYIKNAKKPFCMFITSDYPHGPFPTNTQFSDEDIYQNPYLNRSRLPNEKGYYQNILYDNNQLEEVINFLDETNLSDNTIFIYASDGGLRGKWSVKESGLKIPLIVRWPNVVKPGTTSNDLINLVDILPTIIESTGNKIPKNLDGYSFLNNLKGEKGKRKFTYGISTRQNVRNAKVFPSRSIRNERFKYIINYNSIDVYKNNFTENPIKNQFIKMGAEAFRNVPFEEFYDLQNDPYEMKNLIHNKKYKNQINKLKKQLKKWMPSQSDFLLETEIPFLKPTLHPLDKESQWTKVPSHLINKLTKKDYLTSHY